MDWQEIAKVNDGSDSQTLTAALRWAHVKSVDAPEKLGENSASLQHLLSIAEASSTCRQDVRLQTELMLLWTSVYVELMEVKTMQAWLKKLNVAMLTRVVDAEHTRHLGVYAAQKKYLQLMLSIHPTSSFVLADGRDLSMVKMWTTMKQSIVDNAVSGTTFVGFLTADINLLLPLATTRPELYLKDVLTTLVDLCQLTNSKRSAFELRVLKKCAKNAVCGFLRSYSDLSKETVKNLMDTLVTCFPESRSDIAQLTSLWTSRGVTYTATSALQLSSSRRQTRTKGTVQVTYIYSPEQHVESVLSSLNAYSTVVRHLPPVILPPGFNMSIMPLTLLADMIISSVTALGLGQSADNGLAVWSNIISSLRAETGRYLSQQTPFQTITRGENVGASDDLVLSDATAVKEVKSPVAETVAPYQLQALPEKMTSEQVTDAIWACLERMFSIWIHDTVDDDVAVNNITAEVEAAIKELDGGAEWIYSAVSVTTQWLDREEFAVRGTKRSREEIVHDVAMPEDDEAPEAVTEDQADMDIDAVEDTSVEEMNLDSPIVKEKPVTPEWNFQNALKRLQSCYKGSRSFWGVFCARLIYHLADYTLLSSRNAVDQENIEVEAEAEDLKWSGYDLKMNRLLPFIIQDFPSRWDFAVRWLWEEYYQDSLRPVDATDIDDRHVSGYNFWLCQLVDRLFRQAHNATLAEPSYTPWLVQNSQSDIFRRFIQALPEVPMYLFDSKALPPCPPTLVDEPLPTGEDSDEQWKLPDPALFLKLCNVELTEPLATPLQVLQLQLGLELMYEVITFRPSLRPKGLLTQFMEFCMSDQRVRRIQSIHIACRWWSAGNRGAAANVTPDKSLVSDVADSFAAVMNSSLIKDLGCGYVEGVHVRLTQRVSAFCIGEFEKLCVKRDQEDPWSDSQKISRLHIFFICSLRDGSLFQTLVAMLDRLEEPVQQCVLQLFEAMVPFLAMPSDTNQLGAQVLHALGNNTKLVETHLLTWTKHLLMSPVSPTEDLEPVRLSVMLTRFLHDKLIADELKDSLFWTFIVNGSGLRKPELQFALFKIADIYVDIENVTDNSQTEILVDSIGKAVSRQGTVSTDDNLTLIETFVCFHTMALSDANNTVYALSLRKQVAVTQLFITSPSLTKLFTQHTVCVALQTIVDQLGGNRLPTLYLRSVLMSIVRFGDSMKQFICENEKSILRKIMMVRSLWNGARQAGDSDDERKRNQALWEGWTRCVHKSIPYSFPMMVGISKSYMTLILKKLDSAFRDEFEKWLKTRAVSSGFSRSKVKSALAVIAELKTETTLMVVGDIK